MEIFGIGGFEVALVIIIALVVAGPGRMAVWARTLGRWVSKMRQLWSVTAAQLQRELDDAGVDFKVPRDIPTRRTIVQELSRSSTVNELRKPFDDVQAALKEGQAAATEVTSSLRGVSTELRGAAAPRTAAPLAPKTGPAAARPPQPRPAQSATSAPAPARPAQSPAQSFGTWGGAADKPAKPDDFGTWGKPSGTEEQA